MLNHRPILLLVTSFAPIVWGSTYLVTTELLPPGRPLLAGVLRALPAGLVLIAITRTLPTGSWWWRSLILGTLNIGAFFALLFIAAYRLPGGVAATLGATQPLLAVGLAWLLLGQAPTRRRLLASATGLAGVALLVLRGDAGLDRWGVAAGLGSAVVMATGIVLTQRWRPPVGLLAATGWQLTAGGLVLVPVMVLVEGTRMPALTGAHAAGYVYLGVIGALLAYVLWFRGVGRLPAPDVALLGLLSPLVAVALGWLVLDQGLTRWQLVGGALVLGALAVNRPRSTPRTRAEPRARLG
ncbi:EamA family transporter [Aeromicrobium sp. CF3.5]|uniref:EamA family transporter n=1 Tax=Aeromicrobium sp. CF3.5 TaxID=3373078 RepID=UPI003EE67C12